MAKFRENLVGTLHSEIPGGMVSTPGRIFGRKFCRKLPDGGSEFLVLERKKIATGCSYFARSVCFCVRRSKNCTSVDDFDKKHYFQGGGAGKEEKHKRSLVTFTHQENPFRHPPNSKICSAENSAGNYDEEGSISESILNFSLSQYPPAWYSGMCSNRVYLDAIARNGV